MRKTDTRKWVLSGVFLALGMLLPFLTMQLPSLGNMLLPMHLPVLLCGFICGAPYGFLVGFVTPLLRSILLGSPVLMPMAASMSLELAAYGTLAGLFYRLLSARKEVLRIYLSLLLAMTGGRLVWAAVAKLCYAMVGMSFTMEIFLAGALFQALPGMGLQLILIPVILLALKKMNR